MHAAADAREIRRAILAEWHRTLPGHMDVSAMGSVSGSSPPSVFVGSYGYPRVAVGPMVPPVHGDTGILDAPERWRGRSLEQIVGYRMNLVRGVQSVPVRDAGSRYVGDLQEMAMSSAPIDSDLVFSGSVSAGAHVDDHSALFGPTGRIKSARFSAATPIRPVERAFYDTDLGAREAVMGLYRSGVEISTIQKCLSIAMLGRKRALVPTKWSITATDSMISESLVADGILDYSLIDSCRVFSYGHLGNVFAVVLFPHRWLYGLTEAWHSNGTMGFGSDWEWGAGGIDREPVTAGAYFAARLGVAEYLSRERVQAGAVVLREIRPEYSVPVGVWQIREGVREAMRREPVIAHGLDEALDMASKRTSVPKEQWLAHGRITELLRQRTLSDYF